MTSHPQQIWRHRTDLFRLRSFSPVVIWLCNSLPRIEVARLEEPVHILDFRQSYCELIATEKSSCGGDRTAVPSDVNFTKRTLYHRASRPLQHDLLKQANINLAKFISILLSYSQKSFTIFSLKKLQYLTNVEIVKKLPFFVTDKPLEGRQNWSKIQILCKIGFSDWSKKIFYLL